MWIFENSANQIRVVMLLPDWDEMSTFYKGPCIGTFCLVWASSFRERVKIGWQRMPSDDKAQLDGAVRNDSYPRTPTVSVYKLIF